MQLRLLICKAKRFTFSVIKIKPKIIFGRTNSAQNIDVWTDPIRRESGFWDRLKKTFNTVKPFSETGNAMILPFPCVPRTMSQANVLDTENCSDILKDIADAVQPPRITGRDYSGEFMMSMAAGVDIFEAAGIYTVVLAQDARLIPDALNLVPKEKRPKLNPELFEAYAQWYPDWSFALCCFNNEEAQEALPLLWWYEPMNPEKLFMPALDCHTGKIPTLNTSVWVDHTVAVGSCFAKDTSQLKKLERRCSECGELNTDSVAFCSFCEASLPTVEVDFYRNYQNVSYQNHISNEIKPYLLPRVIGEVYSQDMTNGDFVCQIDDVRKGLFLPVRTLPPNA